VEKIFLKKRQQEKVVISFMGSHARFLAQARNPKETGPHISVWVMTIQSSPNGWMDADQPDAAFFFWFLRLPPASRTHRLPEPTVGMNPPARAKRKSNWKKKPTSPAALPP
jgi:hypothetical protein